METTGRRSEHRRHAALEALLAELARDLKPAAEEAARRFTAPRLPQVLVVGCPRSGTTLAYQWLAATGAFTYPSNLVSRFPSAPWVGARIERLLTDPECDHGGELTVADPNPEPYRSHLGKTRGLGAPHEFWYFWRRHLPAAETHALTAAHLARVDVPRLRAELAAWEDVRRRPLLLKAMILNWNLPWLAEALPDALFLHVRRDVLDTARSLLAARREFSDDTERWYSFRPPAWTRLRDLDPIRQVTGQALHTRRDVETGLDGLSPQRSLTVDYEDLCAAPAAVHAQLRARLEARGCTLPPYAGPTHFPRSAHAADPSTEAAFQGALRNETAAPTCANRRNF